jgi:hypothetical protein
MLPLHDDVPSKLPATIIYEDMDNGGCLTQTFFVGYSSWG